MITPSGGPSTSRSSRGPARHWRTCARLTFPPATVLLLLAGSLGAAQVGSIPADAAEGQSPALAGTWPDPLVRDFSLDVPTGCSGGANPTGDPVGGGPGYSRIIPPSSATFLASDLAGLQSALGAAGPGDIIYVDDSASINISGLTNLLIPGGVTLASGRGNNGSQGALLFTNSYPNPLFRTGGEDVRFTGLRLQGPFPDIGDSNTSSSRGILSSRDGLEVDNSELWGWTYTAVILDKNATNSKVHHNFLHHNRRTGLGYGVMVGYSDSFSPIGGLIEGNLFDDNRHSVASTGNPFSSYEARYNLVLANDTSQSLDRHGTAIPGTWRGGWAGDWTLIHNNTVTRTSGVSVAIRGEPVLGARVDHNHFFTVDEATAIRLYDFNGTKVTTAPKVDLRDNFYGTGTPVSVSIASPVGGANFTSPQVNVTGSASYGYGAGLCRVEVSVDSGPWVVAQGTLAPGWVYTWNATVSLSLQARTTSLRARSPSRTRRPLHR